MRRNPRGVYVKVLQRYTKTHFIQRLNVFTYSILLFTTFNVSIYKCYYFVNS